MIKKETIFLVKKRTKGKCSNPKCNKDGTQIHHCNFKNDYKWDDRDEYWNLALLCEECHNLLHGRIVGKGKDTELADLLRNQANERKSLLPIRKVNKISDDLIKLRKQRKATYKKQLEIFKSLNGGLSPFQVRYRKYKLIND